MLGKLIKYEFKATSRLLLPLYAGLIIVSILNTVFFNISKVVTLPWFFQIFGALLGTLFVLFIMASIIVTFVISIYRFYRNLTGNEGYLMHTLPVTTWSNIITKMLTAVVWSCVSVIVSIICFMVFSLVLMNGLEGFHIFEAIGEFFEAFRMIGFDEIMFMIEFVVLILLSIVSGYSLFFLSIAIGQSFSKNKLLMSFVMYIAIQFVMNFAAGIIIGVGAIIISNVHWEIVYDEMIPYTLFHTIFLGGIVLTAAYSGVLLFLTNYFMKNKLNLQ